MSDTNPYIVSARKYRPSKFKSVVGQKSLANTLKNAITGKRLAQAYLFCGPRGVGKTSCARIFAKTINCLSPTPDGEACGECESCRSIDRGNSFNLVELDAASNNSVDDIRSITEQVNVPAQEGRYRVFIIDEVHMLSNSAFNAFLKTLEEPPKNVVFILATTEKHKVIPTILSRCQIYDFKRITIDDIVDHLEYVAKQEGIATEREALGVIAMKADGAMRDALSIFDQVAASTEGNVSYINTIENLNVLDSDYYFKLTDTFKANDVAGALLLYNEIREKGFDSQFFINGLASHLRDLMVALDARTAPLLETSKEVAEKYLGQAKLFPPGWYYAALKILNECDYQYRTSSNKRLLVELCLIRLCQLGETSKSPFESSDHIKPLEDPTKNLKAAPVTSAEPVAELRRGKPTNKPMSFRLSDASNRESARFGTSLEKRAQAFTHEDFMKGWNEFIDKNPSLHILINAMRGAKPERGENNNYRIMVDHPAQRQAFELSMPKIIEFLRNYLSNDYLSLIVDINSEPVQDKQMHPKEFLKMAVTENPTLGKFLIDIEGELL